MSQPTFSGYSAPSGGGAKIPVLIGAVVALVGASIYNVYEINQLKSQLADTRALVEDEVGKVSASSSSSTKATQATVTKLGQDVAAARAHADQLVGQAKVEASKEADELEKKLSDAEAQQAAENAKVTANFNAVNDQVNAVKADTSTNRENVKAVSADVDKVRAQADATKVELQKTISDLKSTQGDLGIQSGLIATNSKELQALKDLGERGISEFTIMKDKTATRVGDLQVRLTKVDEKKNKFTIEVIADDKKLEKKDRTVGEPIQFLTSRYRQPLELVVMETKKNTIIGYLATPKVLATKR